MSWTISASGELRVPGQLQSSGQGCIFWSSLKHQWGVSSQNLNSTLNILHSKCPIGQITKHASCLLRVHSKQPPSRAEASKLWTAGWIQSLEKSFPIVSGTDCSFAQLLHFPANWLARMSWAFTSMLGHSRRLCSRTLDRASLPGNPAGKRIGCAVELSALLRMGTTSDSHGRTLCAYFSLYLNL